ncbi:hypothetical protein BKA80DRAFT_271577 [Phyllosticta citrichinensis]
MMFWLQMFLVDALRSVGYARKAREHSNPKDSTQSLHKKRRVVRVAALLFVPHYRAGKFPTAHYGLNVWRWCKSTPRRIVQPKTPHRAQRHGRMRTTFTFIPFCDLGV